MKKNFKNFLIGKMKIINYLIQYILIKLFFFICKIIGYKNASNLGELIGKKLVQNLNQKKLLKEILI